MSGNENPEQPRQPHNMQGLLKFALEATKSEDRTIPTQIEQMDPERRRFLEEALKSMTIDIVEELNKAMNCLTVDSDSFGDEQVEALEVVTNYVADVDSANDFFKIGGFSILHPCLGAKNVDVRSETAMLIGELAQNNPFCQQHLLELDILPRLIELLSDETEVQVNAFHAISCMVRSYEPALAAFIEMGGLECMLGLLEFKNEEKLIIKTMFLISAFTKDFPAIADELLKLNAIERIIKTIEPKDEYDTKLELTLSALNEIVDRNGAVERCRQGSLKLKEKLEQTIQLGNCKEDCAEQVEYSQSLMLKIFK